MRFAADAWLWGVLFALVVGALWALQGFRLGRDRARFGHEPQVENLLTGKTAVRRTVSAIAISLAVSLAFLAAAQPQYGQGTRVLPATNLDVVLVLDYSKSMYARDVAPSRIERAKIEVGRLVRKLGGARFGAVAFAGEPLSFPLTSDGAAIAQFFRGLEPNDMPVGGTAIASALRAGEELFQRDPLSARHERVLVLVTDGEDLEGDPVAAAQNAAGQGIRIHVVQIGGRSPEPIPDVDANGIVVGMRKDRQGNLLTTALSPEGEAQLKSIAENARGRLHQAERGEIGIDAIGDELRTLMTEELSERVETVYADVYFYPLGLAVLLLFLESWIGTSRRRELPPQKPRGTKQKRLPKRLRATASLLFLSAMGCAPFDALFERESPTVNDAIQAMEAGEYERANELLIAYLETGECESGVIGAGERAQKYGDASFDLGLGFSALQRGTTPPAGAQADPNAPPAPSADSTLIDCALRLLGPLGENQAHPADLRARAFYLVGNLEVARKSYRAAVTAYDRGLLLIPGQPESPEIDPIGRDLAHNRAYALRKTLEEEKKKEEEQQNSSSDPQDQDEEKDPQDQKDPADQKDQDEQQKPEDSKDEQGKPDPRDSEEEKDQKEPEGSQEEESSEPQAADATPPPAGPSASQDERMLDLLEQAPTLQQHEAQKRGQRVRGRTMEDK